MYFTKQTPPHGPWRRVILVAIAGLLPALCFGALSWETQKLELTTKPGERQATGVYHFKNAGGSAITITGIKPSCGCTTTELAKKTYAPGESGEIRAVLAFGDEVGPQRKSIAVTTDDAPDKPTSLILQVTIPELLTYAPRLLLWRTTEQAEEKPIVISSNGPQKIVGIEFKAAVPANVSTRIEPMVGGTKFQLFIRPTSVAKEMTVAVTCLARFMDGTSHPFTVFALVR